MDERDISELVYDMRSGGDTCYCLEGAEAIEQLRRERDEAQAKYKLLVNNHAKRLEELAEANRALREAESDRNAHRNAAHEADMRTQAAVRSEKRALADIERLNGERSVFADVMAAAAAVIDTLDGEDTDEWQHLRHLQQRLAQMALQARGIKIPTGKESK